MSKQVIKDRAFFEANKLIDAMTGCWDWKRYVNKEGYGQLCYSGNNGFLAHRAAWIEFNGKIPSGLYVCHTCDNRKCINPDHLFLGTAKDNIQDAVKKNRIIRKGDLANRKKLCLAIVSEIRSDYSTSNEDPRVYSRRISAIYQVTPQTIWNIINNRTWNLNFTGAA
jgi:hypothetical protein